MVRGSGAEAALGRGISNFDDRREGDRKNADHPRRRNRRGGESGRVLAARNASGTLRLLERFG